MSNNFAFGGSIPEKYDRYLGPYLFEPYAVYITEKINGKPRRVLEIASGTGRVTKHIAEKIGSNAQLLATDLNPDMLNIAQQRVKNQNIQWQVADAQALPFEDNSFDCIICQFGYMFLPEKEKGFAEAYRVLKPGGQFLYSTWDKIENNICAFISQQVATDFFKDNPPAFYKVPFSMFDPEELRSYMNNAGFINSTAERISLTGQSPSAMDIATGFVEGNPIINEILKEDPAQVENIKLSITKRIHEQVSKDPVSHEMNAWICEAGK